VNALALGEVDGEPVLAVGSADNAVRLWDARTGRPRGEPLNGHMSIVNALALGKVDGEPVVVSWSQDETVRLWDARSHKSLQVVPLRGASVMALSVGTDSLVALSADRGILVFDFSHRLPRVAPEGKGRLVAY
jgi:WD40 repeat protein